MTDAAGRPVHGATLQIEGHMQHPGMAPVIEDAVETEEGVYTARLTPSMAGEWILYVSGKTAGGTALRVRTGSAMAAAEPGG